MKIVRVLGSDGLSSYLSKYSITLDSQLANLVGRHSRKPWSKFISDDNQHLVSPEAIDFIVSGSGLVTHMIALKRVEHV